MNLTSKMMPKTLAVLLFLTHLCFATHRGGAAESFPFVRARPASHLLVIEERELSTPAIQAMVASLQGLSARLSADQIFILSQSSALWVNHLTNSYSITSEPVLDPFDLLLRFKPVLKGYLLFDSAQTNSINAATSLAGPLTALPVEKSLEEKVRALGITNRLADLSARDEAWVRRTYPDAFNRQIVVEQKESFGLPLRDYAALANAFTFYDGNSVFRNSLVASLPPDALILGWGDATRGEEKFIGPASKAGLFTVPADHARNISVLSGVRETNLQQKASASLPTSTNDAHYVCFLITDGDNLQWNLNAMHRYVADFRETDIPVGFGLSPSLVDFAPSVMRWYYDTARPGKDHYTVGPSGGGYLYPSHYPPAELDIHLRRLNDAMHRADLGIIQILDFDSFPRLDLWDKFTAQTAVDALFYLDYSRYDKVGGKILWSNRKPVISARHMLWGGLPRADEQTLIERLNSASRNPRDPAAYSLVAVHAWSKRRANIQAVVSGLDPAVQVVAPDQFVRLLAKNLGPSSR